MLYIIESGDDGTIDGNDDGTADEGEADDVNDERPQWVSDGGVVESLTDPVSLADSEGVEYLAETHDDDRPFHDADADGAAVVGVTDGDGAVLLLEHPDQPPILPMCRVEPGGDWAAVGRGTVDDVPGLEIDLVGVERVRALEYSDDGQTCTNYYVIFRGAVAPDGDLPAEPTVDDPEWDAGWYGTVEGRTDDDMAADIELFLE